MFPLRWRRWAQARRGRKSVPESSKNFTIGRPRFRPVILALPGPLIPRVILVLEGWTGAGLSRRCAQPARHVDQNPLLHKCPARYRVATRVKRRDIRGGGTALVTLAASSTAMTSLGGPDLDLLGANLGYSDDGQALPTVLCNLFFWTVRVVVFPDRSRFGGTASFAKPAGA